MGGSSQSKKAGLEQFPLGQFNASDLLALSELAKEASPLGIPTEKLNQFTDRFMALMPDEKEWRRLTRGAHLRMRTSGVAAVARTGSLLYRRIANLRYEFAAPVSRTDNFGMHGRFAEMGNAFDSEGVALIFAMGSGDLYWDCPAHGVGKPAPRRAVGEKTS